MYDLSLLKMFLGKSTEQKLIFIPCAAENPTNSSREIPELDLFRYLLKEDSDSFIREIFLEKLLQNLREIDHESKIIQVETHRENCTHINEIDSTKSFQIFVVFKTVGEKDGEFWWSLEKIVKHAVVLQRSRDKDFVKKKFKGETRKVTELIAENLEGKGCMRELLTLLWIHMIVDVKYQRHLSRCESLIPLIMKKITKIRYEYENDFNYSTLSSEERNPDLSEMINLLSNVSNWHPLVVATYLGDTVLLDRLKQDGQYNINGVYNNFTLLNLAVLFDKTEMFQHFLQKTNADPAECDEKGRNALHMAAKFNREKEIVNSLLKIKNIKIDQFDKTGTTALNHAIMTSNTTVVQCLLDNGANPKKQDQIGRLPLHVAAFYATDTKVIDLLLEKKETVNIDDCDKFGVTALHHAAMASNNKMARHLLARGADINRRDERGVTPLHVAAFHAKDMDLINLFLNHEKVNLHYCDELGQNVIAYAQKNTYGMRKEIIDRVNEIDYGVIKEYNVLKLTKSTMDISIWKILGWDLYYYFGNASKWLPPLSSLLLKVSKLKLFYIPFADVKPGKGNEISESVLIRYIANKRSIKQPNISKPEISNTTKLLGDLDHYSNITQIQIYQSNGSNSVANLMSAVHTFIIFKTTSDKDGDHWWSLDKNADYIVLQRSRDKDAVKNKFGGQVRKDVKFNFENLVEKCSIKDLLTILWIHQVMEEFNQNKNPNRQSFVNFVSKIIKKIGDEDNSPHQSDGNPETLDLIQTLVSGICKWHPLYLPIYLGNTNLFDRIKEMTKFNHFHNKLSPLNLAIAIPCKTKMIRHILEKCNADPAIRDASGRNALEMAAMLADDTQVLDLLLKHENVQIDGRDESGRSALHFAAIASNDITAKHLIKMGANPNRKDKLGRTPLHLAALNAKDINIVDVLLNDKHVRINSLDNSGQNALFYAGCNRHGLTKEIVCRFKENGLITKRRSSNNSSITLDPVIQYSNKEEGLSLLPVKRESDGSERKKQRDNPHHTVSPQSKGSQHLNFGLNVLLPKISSSASIFLFIPLLSYLTIARNFLHSFIFGIKRVGVWDKQ